MPKKGLSRYLALFANIKNFGEYLFNKSDRSKRSLSFVTKPNVIKFQVPYSLYQVFKEIFMADVYNIKKLVKELPQKPVIVDIGANAGFFDILIFSKIKDAVIYAYEPLESNVSLFNKTISANKFITSNISMVKKAVTGLPKPFLELFIEDTADNSVVASTFLNFDKRNTKRITVECITLTAIITDNSLEKIDLLKLDCEGSEYDIIYNTSVNLIKRIKRLSIEVHDLDNDKNNINTLNNYLLSLGYITTYSPINNFCYALEAENIANG